MTDSTGPLLALDVGGANIKVAHEVGFWRTIPFELWREPARLPSVLRDIASSTPPSGRIALTMTAELCDCYETKAAGVRAVVDAVDSGFPERPISVWCLDGRFRDVGSVVADPALAAAANWLALAEVAARLIPTETGLLIDVGSTTTDIIALARGHAHPAGRTDTERLRTGELVYAGVRRTPVCCVAAELEFDGRRTGLAAEFFATTHDVYLSLGSVPADQHDGATADARPATVDRARDRLARMVGADRETFSLADARALSGAVHSALLSRLVSAAARVIARQAQTLTSVVISGTGEFLARAVAESLPRIDSVVSLGKRWGVDASAAACAHALVFLATEGAGSSD